MLAGNIKAQNRFWRKVIKTDTCWNWVGGKTKGYGLQQINNRHYYVHRLSYEYYRGNIPTGLVLDHLCRNPAYVNPDHLEAVTNIENIRRGIRSTHIGLWHKSKTHCKFGHPYNETNTYLYKNGRYCKSCKYKRYINARRKYQLAS